MLVGGDGRVLVGDFGLARDADPHRRTTPGICSEGGSTRVSVARGSPGYMPPEQFGGRAVDARADVFSFCVSLWEAFHGERPFVGERPVDVEGAILRGEWTESTRGRVPSWLRAVLLRGLECEPSRRWRTMGELLSALECDPTPRRRAALAVGGLALAMLAVGIGVGVEIGRSRSQEALIADR